MRIVFDGLERISPINKYQTRLGKLDSVPRVWMRPNRQFWVMERETRDAPDQVGRRSGVTLFESLQLRSDILKRCAGLHGQLSLIVIASCTPEDI